MNRFMRQICLPKSTRIQYVSPRLSNKRSIRLLTSQAYSRHTYSSTGERAKLSSAIALASLGSIAIALSQLPAVKLEASYDDVFVNWSASHECHPIAFYTPETIEEAQEILEKYNKKKQKIRCIGAGISPNGLGFSGKRKQASGAIEHEAMISMAMFDRILNVDTEKQQVTVEAGVVVSQLMDKLSFYGLTMQNVASIRDQHVGGIIQAGCHGTGAKIAPIDDHVVQMEILTPAKGKLILSKTQNSELFELAKCGLGALGVVTKVTLQCTKQHHLLENTILATLEDVKANHLTWLNTFQHLRYMWIPYTDSVVVVQCDPISSEEAKTNASKYSGVSISMDIRLAVPRSLYVEESRKYGSFDQDYVNWSFTKLRDKLLELNPLDKEHVKQVNAAEKEFWRCSQGYRIALSDDIIGFDCGGQQLVQEVAFPLQGMNDIEFIETLMTRINKSNIPAHSPIEQRWTSRSTSSMSPAYSNDANQIFSWVGIIMYLPTLDMSTRDAITARFQAYYDLYKEHMSSFNGYEHWAKIEIPDNSNERKVMCERLRKRYPIDRFKEARDELDPNHILSNHIVDAICEE